MEGRFGSLSHLAGRFLRAISRAAPPAADERWALAALEPAERELWRRMTAPDRRHAVSVAREAVRLFDAAGALAGREIIAAALLHDVGKLSSRLGTLGRVGATVASVAVGRDRLRGRARRYVDHDRLGGELLRAAGSDPFTIAWAEQHHLAPERWTVDRRVGALLKAADG